LTYWYLIIKFHSIHLKKNSMILRYVRLINISVKNLMSWLILIDDEKVYQCHHYRQSPAGASHSSWPLFLQASCLSPYLSVVICIVRFYSIPHSKRFDDSIVLRYLRFINILVKKLMSIDVDWWWKIHDVKRSMPRANISVSSPATGSSQRCLSSSLSLFFSVSLSLSLFSETTLPYLPTYLSLPTCAIAGCRWWTSLGQGPPPKTCSNSADYRRRSPLRFVLPRSTWSTDNAILGVNRRSREAV